MKWKAEFDNLGLTNETISQGLRTKIKDYYELQNGIKELKESIANPSINDNVDDLKSQVDDLQESLSDFDTKLVEAIRKFHANKDKYAELGRKMAEGRSKKKQGQQGKPAEPPVNTKPTPASKPVEKTETVTATVVDEEKDKKGGGWGLFWGALALSVLTFGLYKMRD